MTSSFDTLLLDDLGKAFVFKKYRPTIRNHLLKAGVQEVPYRLFGILFWLATALALVVFILYLYPWINAHILSSALQFIGYFIGIAVILGAIVTVLILAIYFYTDLMIFDRTSKMESVLQDFLRTVAQNLKGGMPFERALWSSIKPEFGPLAQEIRLAAKKVITGSDIEDALTDFANKYDSPMLRRSFILIIESLKGGGRVAEIIERVADDIEETKELKAEMSATNLTYIIFISFVVIIVAPGLFSLALQFLNMLTSFTAKLGSAISQSGTILPFGLRKPAIIPEEFVTFSIEALLVISTFAAMIVSILRTGTIKGGIRFIPIFAVLSVLFYVLFKSFTTAVFSNIIPP